MVRTSVLFASGEGPNGMTRTLYGGEPEPVMDMLRLPHSIGVDSKSKEYAAAKHGRNANSTRGDSMLVGQRSVWEAGGKERETARWCDQPETNEDGRRCGTESRTWFGQFDFTREMITAHNSTGIAGFESPLTP